MDAMILRRARAVLDGAERELGELSRGQCIDLLMDNDEKIGVELSDSDDASRLLEAIRASK